MTRSQIILRPPSSNRRRPLLSSQRSTSSSLSSSKSISISSSSSSKHSSSARFAEVAGGTTAECAVVCCCCPCGLMELLILAIYKVPAGLCKRILRKRRRKRLLKKGLLPPLPSTYSSNNKKRNFCGCDETEMYIHPMTAEKEREWVFIDGFGGSGGVEEKELMELEKEMWERFYNTGFWRSPSQRETIKSVSAQGDMNQALSYCVSERDKSTINEYHQSINGILASTEKKPTSRWC